MVVSLEQAVGIQETFHDRRLTHGGVSTRSPAFGHRSPGVRDLGAVHRPAGGAQRMGLPLSGIGLASGMGVLVGNEVLPVGALPAVARGGRPVSSLLHVARRRDILFGSGIG
jgi:hypothetical protein